MHENPGMQGTRHEPRFSVRNMDATAVTVAVRDDCEGSEPIKGVAADVSATGLRLALVSPPPKDATVSVHFCIPEINIDLVLEGTIRWTQPKDAKSWWVGCALETRIPESALQLMATHEVMDRRQDARLPASCKAKAKWELSSTVTDVTIVNYSVGGCAIETDQPVEPASDRMMLVFDSSDDESVALPIRVIWSRNGTKFGCEFLSNRCYLRMRKFVESESQTIDRVNREAHRQTLFSRDSTNWRWIAIAAMVLLAVRSFDFIGRASAIWNQLGNGRPSEVVLQQGTSDGGVPAETRDVSDPKSQGEAPDA